jgi:hypothetical protein
MMARLVQPDPLFFQYANILYIIYKIIIHEQKEDKQVGQQAASLNHSI